MVLFMDLQCEWAGYPDNGAVEKALIWRRKQHKLVAVNYSAGELLATVQEGFWFSSHEQWKTLVLPYLDIPRVRDVFENCERARLHNSVWRLPFDLGSSIRGACLVRGDACFTAHADTA